MAKVEVINADIMEWCKTHDGPKMHACLCDPPYCLSSISKRFGKSNSAPAQEGTDGAFRRASTGFMGMAWDNEIAFDPATWAAIQQHLYPGAFICAFNGSRSWHRMACAMEDSGLILHPTIFLYGFATGFPKATNIASALDRREGKAGIPEREWRGGMRSGNIMGTDYSAEGGSSGVNMGTQSKIIRGAESDLAKQWSGHRYGLQAMKPSVEPIILAQVPYSGKPLDCIINTGAGALNIDGARIGYKGESPCGSGKEVSDCATISFRKRGAGGNGGNVTHESGRWPSNLILSEETAMLLDAQSGGASRFFFQSNWNAEVAERIDEASPLFYTSKASSKERKKSNNDSENNHPTLKPLNLTKYLATLLAPAEGYNRRLLIPFSGAGSEIIGAELSGQWEHITGVEQSSDYCKIAEGRIAYWQGKTGLFNELNTEAEEAEDLQSSLEDMFGTEDS